ncbi:vWA domain-containing protein [Lentzea sp. NPDC003310]|uniref:vWA domain-containing protein n=1 Tax=Lentzea sp. NPDC003310 TaxID=3154447 RepID=UPI0033B22D32
MSSWIRRDFDGIGLTQAPPGPHLAAVQARYGGTVLLCIDVSWSMEGKPLREAISGGVAFLEEADRAHYDCGLILWSRRVERSLPPSTPLRKVIGSLRDAKLGGGTDVVPALKRCKEIYEQMRGDRVVCIFSDGEIPRIGAAERLARELCEMGVRIVVRGLGPKAARTLGRLTCPGGDDDTGQVIVDVADLRAGIASMAGGLTKNRRTKGK